MSDKPTKLIVLLAFVRGEEGELRPAFEPCEIQSEDKAEMDARRLAALGTYAGVITWSRSADLVNGEFGEPIVLFQHGDAGDGVTSGAAYEYPLYIDEAGHLGTRGL